MINNMYMKPPCFTTFESLLLANYPHLTKGIHARFLPYSTVL